MVISRVCVCVCVYCYSLSAHLGPSCIVFVFFYISPRQVLLPTLEANGGCMKKKDMIYRAYLGVALDNTDGIHFDRRPQ